MDTPLKVRVSSPADLAAAVPSLIGFTPADGSLVVVTFTDRRVGMTARVDGVPVDRVDALAAQLAPVIRHGEPGLTGLVVIGWEAATGTAADLMWALGRLGLPTMEAMVVQGDRVCDDCCQGPWLPLGVDVVRPASVVNGDVLAASREDLAARIDYSGTDTPSYGGDQLIVDGWRASVADVDTRDHTLAVIGRHAGEHLAQDVDGLCLTLRHVGPSASKRADLLALLAVAAWLHGNGALANIALDQAPAGHGHSLTILLRQALGMGMPPSDLRELLHQL